MDTELRLELMAKIQESVECLLLLIREIHNLSVGSWEAADRLIQGLGQDPDGPPLPPVEEFFKYLDGNKEAVKTIMESLQLIARNQAAMARAITPPLVQ